MNHNQAIRCLLPGIAIACAVMVIGGTASAPAGGLLDALFGGLTRPAPPATPIQSSLTMASVPRASITVTPRAPRETEGTVAYCVRLCDGRHFPLPRLAASRPTPTELCTALCPTSRTSIYWGSRIDRSVTSNGSRYLDMEMALRYRRGFVGACTCNGKDIFGTAPVSIYADLTLRPGDIVVTEKGLKTFVGSRDGRHRPADFTPVRQVARTYAGLPADERGKRLPKAAVSVPERLPTPLIFDTRVIFDATPLARTLASPKKSQLSK